MDDEAKLTLHGLQQHYVKLKENEKNKKLFELLDVLEFNQVGGLRDGYTHEEIEILDTKWIFSSGGDLC